MAYLGAVLLLPGSCAALALPAQAARSIEITFKGHFGLVLTAAEICCDLQVGRSRRGLERKQLTLFDPTKVRQLAEA